MDSPPGERLDHAPDQRWIDVAGHEVGRAFVVRVEQEASDTVANLFIGNFEQVGGVVASKLGDVTLKLRKIDFLCGPSFEHGVSEGREIARRLIEVGHITSNPNCRASFVAFVGEKDTVVLASGKVNHQSPINFGIGRKADHRGAFGVFDGGFESFTEGLRTPRPGQRNVAPQSYANVWDRRAFA